MLFSTRVIWLRSDLTHGEVVLKIGGKKLVTKNYKYVTLTKGEEEVTFKVGPLPSNFAYKYQDTGLLDYPEPPMKEVKLASGKVARKGRDEGGGFQYAEDRKDPTYRRKMSEVNRRVTALRLKAVLADDPNVEFEEEPEEGSSKATWLEYADDLATSIEEQLTSDEVDYIIEASDEVACVYKVEEAIEAF